MKTTCWFNIKLAAPLKSKHKNKVFESQTPKTGFSFTVLQFFNSHVKWFIFSKFRFFCKTFEIFTALNEVKPYCFKPDVNQVEANSKYFLIISQVAHWLIEGISEQRT